MSRNPIKKITRIFVAYLWILSALKRAFVLSIVQRLPYQEPVEEENQYVICVGGNLREEFVN